MRNHTDTENTDPVPPSRFTQYYEAGKEMASQSALYIWELATGKRQPANWALINQTCTDLARSCAKAPHQLQDTLPSELQEHLSRLEEQNTDTATLSAILLRLNKRHLKVIINGALATPRSFNDIVIVRAAEQLREMHRNTLHRPLDTINAHLRLFSLQPIHRDSLLGHVVRSGEHKKTILQLQLLLDYYDACLCDSPTIIATRKDEIWESIQFLTQPDGLLTTPQPNNTNPLFDLATRTVEQSISGCLHTAPNTPLYRYYQRFNHLSDNSSPLTDINRRLATLGFQPINRFTPLAHVIDSHQFNTAAIYRTMLDYYENNHPIASSNQAAITDGSAEAATVDDATTELVSNTRPHEDPSELYRSLAEDVEALASRCLRSSRSDPRFEHFARVQQLLQFMPSDYDQLYPPTPTQSSAATQLMALAGATLQIYSTSDNHSGFALHVIQRTFSSLNTVLEAPPSTATLLAMLEGRTAEPYRHTAATTGLFAIEDRPVSPTHTEGTLAITDLPPAGGSDASADLDSDDDTDEQSDNDTEDDPFAADASIGW